VVEGQVLEVVEEDNLQISKLANMKISI
jgi:hypothetical protein